MSESDLESLYREAQSALKSRDYVRASELLKQVLVIDENYKDVSRLLADIVREKRRRWYNDVRIWGTLGVMLLIGLGFFIAPKISSLYVTKPSAPTTTPLQPSPTVTVLPTQIVLPTPTPIPLTWKRISIGQEFERDAVVAFATDKKDSDVIYAAMKNAGVYKTIDGGISWQPAHQGLASTQVESLLIDSQNPHILYASTMDGVFKTQDGAENWHRIGEGTYLLMDMQDNSHLYAHDENGIYETKDQGNNWTTIYTLKKGCPDTISSWAIHPADGDMLFIGGGETCAGVYQSSDSGGTWTLIGLKEKPNLEAIGIGLDEHGKFSIYTYFRSSVIMAESGIYFSHDEGASWSQVSLGCEILISDPDNPAEVYCTGTYAGSYRLSMIHKKGDTWQNIPGSDSKVYTAIHIDHPYGADRIIAGGTDVTNFESNIGIFMSTDNGLSWTKKNNGIGSTRSELKIDPMNTARMFLTTNYYASYSNCTLYRSKDGGKSWSSIRTGGWCGPSFDSANALFLLEWSALQKSLDGGENWLLNFPRIEQYSKNPTSGDFTRYNQDVASFLSTHTLPSEPQSVSANPYKENLVYAVGKTIYYSPDAGVSWQLSEGSEGSWDARLFYTDQSKMMYAIGRTHQSYSTDNGKTWQACGKDITTSQSDSRLALDLQGSRLYLATPGQGVLISADNCQSWQASNKGLSNLFVNTLAIDSNDSNKIYAGTDGGAYISFDGGQTWGQVNDGLLGATVVYSIAVDKDSNVYAATPYGVFKLEGK